MEGARGAFAVVFYVCPVLFCAQPVFASLDYNCRNENNSLKKKKKDSCGIPNCPPKSKVTSANASDSSQIIIRKGAWCRERHLQRILTLQRKCKQIVFLNKTAICRCFSKGRCIFHPSIHFKVSGGSITSPPAHIGRGAGYTLEKSRRPITKLTHM